jgi:SAM-dependent methyltransferase
MNPNKALWEKGDFTRIAATMRESGEALVAAMGISRGMKVLDLGCGDGTTALPAARLGADVLGVDISSPLVEAGNRRDHHRAGQRTAHRVLPAELAPRETGVTGPDQSRGTAVMVAVLLRVVRPHHLPIAVAEDHDSPRRSREGGGSRRARQEDRRDECSFHRKNLPDGK